MVHDARIVKIDEGHRDLPYNKWLGDSVGYYDGDTLVVTTKNFSEWEIAQGYGTNASMNMVLTERFHRWPTMNFATVSPSRILSFTRSHGQVKCQCVLLLVYMNTLVMKVTTPCLAFGGGPAS